jgi:hypothetical protein
VFAQLTVASTYQGPHVFVVRIRDDAGRIMPGVRIVDCGPKMGLNGVDNGRIWFSNVRVPVDCLLDRYAQVSPAGVYSSAIPSVSARFGALLFLWNFCLQLMSTFLWWLCKYGLHCILSQIDVKHFVIYKSVVKLFELGSSHCHQQLSLSRSAICVKSWSGLAARGSACAVRNRREIYYDVTAVQASTGRIAQAAIDSLKVGCVIAIRYALKEPQF